MAINFTQKEKTLLQDQQKHEQVCIEKYQNYAAQAQDPQLQQLFNSLAAKEQHHLDSINQMLNGQVPNVNQQQGQGGAQQAGMQTGMQAGMQAGMQQGVSANQGDAHLCNDMLMTEKYVSGAYDTAIFEFTDTNVRQALNHIQKEEQQHGESIYQYMSANGLYNPQ